MNQKYNIFTAKSLSSVVSFERLAKLRSIFYNGGEKPIDNAPVAGCRVNWEHYGKVLEAKNHQYNNS